MSWFSHLPIAKIAYTCILLLIVWIALSEINKIWLDKRIYLKPFSYYKEGEVEEVKGEKFVSRVLQHHRLLSHLFTLENARRKEEKAKRPKEGIDLNYFPSEPLVINRANSALAELELSVQGINFKEILTTLRRWVSTPNEITGSIEANSDQLLVSIDWPNGPSVTRGDLVTADFVHLRAIENESNAAFHTACSVIWAQAARNSETLSNVPRSVFCDWAAHWVEAQTLSDKLSAKYGQIGDEDIKGIRSYITSLSHIIANGTDFPEFYRLRAELIALLPDDSILQDEQNMQLSDLATYSELTTAEAGNLEAIVLAHGRPVYMIANNQVEFPGTGGDLWEAPLKAASKFVDKALASTGRISGTMDVQAKYPYVGTGFVISPTVVLTSNHLLSDELQVGAVPASWNPSIDFNDMLARSDIPTMRKRITHVLYRNKEMGVALLEIEDSVQLHLTLSKEVDDANAGVSVFLVGYPTIDTRLPVETYNEVFNGVTGVKRLMPGKISSEQHAADNTPPLIMHDALTSAGTSGAPIIDLDSGVVLGVHYGRNENGQGLAIPSSAILSDPLFKSLLADGY